MLTYVWADTASRPTALKDLRYEWAYLFGAVCAGRGVGVGLVLPLANSEMMNLHLVEISKAVTPGHYAVLVLDGVGWHQTGGRLTVPDNLTLLHLPPYSPELNPVENIWQFLRQNGLSNRVFDGYNAIVDACCDAWMALMNRPDQIRSIAGLMPTSLARLIQRDDAAAVFWASNAASRSVFFIADRTISVRRWG